MGTSPRAVGIACVQQDLRNVLAYLDVPVLGQSEVLIQFTQGLVDADANINDGTRKFLQGFMDRYAAFVARHV